MEKKPTAWRNVIAMSVTIFCTLTGIFCWFRVLPNHLRHLGADEFRVSLVYFFMGFSNRLPQLWGGRLADRVGRKGIIVAVTIIMGLSYAVIGHASTWWAVMLAIVVCWIAGGAQWPAIMAIITESVPEDKRGRALGMLEAAAMGGLTLGPYVGERIEEACGNPDVSWRALLMLCCGLYLMSAVVRAMVLRETRTSDSTAPRGCPALGWVSLVLPVAAGVAVLANMMFFLTTDGPVTAMYLEDELRMSRPQIDRVFFYAGLVALASAPLAGWAVDRFGHVAVLRVAFWLTLVILLPFYVAAARGTHVHRLLPGSEPWLIAAFFLPSELFTVAFQRLMTAGSDASRRAATVGAYGLVTGIFSPWIYLAVGPLYWVSHTQPLAAAAGLSAVCFVLTMLLRRRAAF